MRVNIADSSAFLVAVYYYRYAHVYVKISFSFRRRVRLVYTWRRRRRRGCKLCQQYPIDTRLYPFVSSARIPLVSMF